MYYCIYTPSCTKCKLNNADLNKMCKYLNKKKKYLKYFYKHGLCLKQGKKYIFKRKLFQSGEKNKKYILQFCFSSKFILIFTLEN